MREILLLRCKIALTCTQALLFQVLKKFNREGTGFVDFLDFVTYVPLFIEIHKRIVEDPFNDTLEIWC